MNPIDVNIKPYKELFDRTRKIVIPEYQRPYIWGREKSEELLKDLDEYFLKSKPDKPYYLGTILYYFNRKDRVYEVIDGQQRITTLLIIKRLLSEKDLPEYEDVIYNSHQSIKCIKDAQTYFQQNIELLQKLEEARFLDQLHFTLIVTNAEDDAFTFFDTQNNRGVKLGSTDFLKAYHLRAISSPKLQDVSARQWEKASTKINEGSLLSHLFEKVLWRSRNWKGQTKIDFESKKEILKTFQKATIKTNYPDSYPLYPNLFNRQSIGHQYQSNGELLLIQSNQKSFEKADYPFSLRQPLHKGMNFFRYSDKYIAIYNLFFNFDEIVDDDIQQVRNFYSEVYNQDMSVYLRHFMQLCIVVYYDVFGNRQLLHAVYAFDYLIGSIRLIKQQVKKEAISLCLKKDLPNNILDVIANAYLPDELFDFLYSIKDLEEIYISEKVKLDDGVRGRYKKRVLKYFNKNDKSLTNRKIWGRI